MTEPVRYIQGVRADQLIPHNREILEKGTKERQALLEANKRREAEAIARRDARLEDEERARQEAQGARREEKRVAAESALKTTLRAAFLDNGIATPEEFEESWPELRRKALEADALRLRDRELEAARARFPSL